MTLSNSIRLFFGAAFLSSVAASAAPPETRPPRLAAVRAAAPAQTDAALEKDIRDRLARSKIGADGFTVRVQGGVATFEGKTGIVQHKGAATRMARTAGAVRVINRIEVSDEARRKASANLAQGRRRAQIKRGGSGPRSEDRDDR